MTKDIVNNKLAAFENLTKLKEKVEDEITKKREVESKSVEAKSKVKTNLQRLLELLLVDIETLHQASRKDKTHISKILDILSNLLNGKRGQGRLYLIDFNKYETILGHINKVSDQGEKNKLKEAIDKYRAAYKEIADLKLTEVSEDVWKKYAAPKEQ